MYADGKQETSQRSTASANPEVHACLCISCAFLALAFTAPSAQSLPRPNVVMFIMDDLGTAT